MSSNGRGNKVAEVTTTATATATATVAATTVRTKTAVVSGGGNSEGHGHTQQSNHFGSERNSSGGDSNGGYGCNNNQLQAEMVMAVLVAVGSDGCLATSGGWQQEQEEASDCLRPKPS